VATHLSTLRSVKGLPSSAICNFLNPAKLQHFRQPHTFTMPDCTPRASQDKVYFFQIVAISLASKGKTEEIEVSVEFKI
jgi:hypothetical protein